MSVYDRLAQLRADAQAAYSENWAYPSPGTFFVLGEHDEPECCGLAAAYIGAVVKGRPAALPPVEAVREWARGHYDVSDDALCGVMSGFDGDDVETVLEGCEDRDGFCMGVTVGKALAREFV